MLLFLVESDLYQQILDEKNVIVVPKEMMKMRKRFFEISSRKLFQRIFQHITSERISLISENVACALHYLHGTLAICLQNTATDFMDQFLSHNFLLSPSLDFYKELHPQIRRLKKITAKDYAVILIKSFYLLSC